MIAASEEYDDPHRLVDRLTLNQARALRAVASELVESEPPPPAETHGRRRRLSFAGIIADEPDSAQRSEEILLTRFRRHLAHVHANMCAPLESMARLRGQDHSGQSAHPMPR
ncbi:hypothetical protein ACFV1N_03900 [Streptosporangium canum]|uniref:hypothetical protein n=1 Tax=Streptosporangium canum TaxID=324952 RepID=UPI0036920EE4